MPSGLHFMRFSGVRLRELRFISLYADRRVVGALKHNGQATEVLDPTSCALAVKRVVMVEPAVCVRLEPHAAALEKARMRPLTAVGRTDDRLPLLREHGDRAWGRPNTVGSSAIAWSKRSSRSSNIAAIQRKPRLSGRARSSQTCTVDYPSQLASRPTSQNHTP